ncbi:hypothetical protein H072_8154 [Dactylellina haptotyla CBS 200.50]|uniref:Alpha-1,3-mannosyltransferase n=1 Tax=Dactylellina haptotyla (strain CBS 200.50) TaxID=1284197 RepID=S8BSC4_DACHA|nr:hypothetical protein H072_8154 [Dactylellina haptotyla CBS 200.50]
MISGKSTFRESPRKEGRCHTPDYLRRRRNLILKTVAIFFTFILALRYITSHLSSGVTKTTFESVRYNGSTVGSADESPKSNLPIKEASTLEMTIQTQRPLSDDRELKEALHQVFKLLPSKSGMKNLLSPIQGTGEVKLRETGIRAKKFKSLFEAWEKLHLVAEARDEVSFRTDIIQELIQNTPSKHIAITIDRYERYRIFLEEFAALLFPYIITGSDASDSTSLDAQMSLHAKIHKGGRGIVLSGGNRQAPFLLTSIPSLRNLGCNLPIEIMYLGDGDLSPENRAKLEKLDGVVTRDIKVRDEGWKLAGWAGKPFAILLSSFREVIFIDADSLFFKNPEVLFEDQSYKRTGALFFKDRVLFPENKQKWLKQILPEPISQSVKDSRFWAGTSGHMQESGVVVVDKWRHFVSMLMVTRMNGPDRDGDKSKGIKGIYDMVYGDKETFWLGWELVGDLDYAFHQGDVGVMGQLTKQDPKQAQHFEICAPQLLHLDVEGNPLWFNGWILMNKFEEDVAKRQAGTFTNYIREKPTSKHQWQLKHNNNACLAADSSFMFTPAEKGALEFIMTEAKATGAYKK